MRNSKGQFEKIPMQERYGKLTVIEFDHKQGNNQYYYKCKCDCGKEIVVRKTLLTTGKQKSCGCIKRHAKIKENKYEIDGDITYIFLSNGEKAIIDTDELPKILQKHWSKHGRYVLTQTNGKIAMHQYILQGKNIDHINRNTLDNRKCNLRFCTNQQNCMNRGIRIDNKTGIKGIQKRGNSWIATITYKGKRMQKNFKNKEDAIYCRQKWEEEYFREWR